MPQKSFFFAFLVFFHIDTTYIKLEWNFENFLIFWCTLVARVSWDNMSTSLSWDNMSLGQYVAGQNVPSVQLKIHSLFIVIIMKCVSVFAYLCMQICVYVFVILFLLLPNGGREGVADQLSLLL